MKSTGTRWLGCLGWILIAGCSGEKTTPNATASGETSATATANAQASKSSSGPEDSLPGSGGEKKLTIGSAKALLWWQGVLGDLQRIRGESATLDLRERMNRIRNETRSKG